MHEHYNNYTIYEGIELRSAVGTRRMMTRAQGLWGQSRSINLIAPADDVSPASVGGGVLQWTLPMDHDEPTGKNFLSEEAWPDPALMPVALQRIALKMGLLLLGFAHAEQLLGSRPETYGGAAAFARAGSLLGRFEAPAAEERGLAKMVVVQRLGCTLAVLDRFRELLVFGVRGVSSADLDQPALLNWVGRYSPDAERQAGWVAPGEKSAIEAPKAMRAGQVQEWELDTAMLHLGIALRDLDQMGIGRPI